MSNKLFHTFFSKNDKERLKRVEETVNLFYANVLRNEHPTDCDYLSRIFREESWQLLGAKKEQNGSDPEFLDKGILSMLLFTCYSYLEDQCELGREALNSIKKSVQDFSPSNRRVSQLRLYVLQALLLVEGKQDGLFDGISDKSIYKSITWTLQNIIIPSQKNPEKTTNY